MLNNVMGSVIYILYNKLSDCVTAACSLNSFKQKLKDWLVE